MSISVVPAIIPHSLQEIEQKMQRVKGLVDFVQIDVMDGVFAPEPTWPYMGDGGEVRFRDIVNEEESMPFWKELNFEVDLMVQHPLEVLDDWISAGAQRVIIHIESVGDMAEMIAHIRERSGSAGSLLKTEVGIAFVPSTPFADVEPYIQDIDFVQCMGSDKIGFHGVELDERVYDIIRDIRANNPELPIAVDIGVNVETAPLLVEAGCTKLVSGSALFSAEDIKKRIKEFSTLGE